MIGLLTFFSKLSTVIFRHGHFEIAPFKIELVPFCISGYGCYLFCIHDPTPVAPFELAVLIQGALRIDQRLPEQDFFYGFFGVETEDLDVIA